MPGDWLDQYRPQQPEVAYNQPTQNPYYQYAQGPNMGYQPNLENLIFGIAPEKSGLYDFMRGGAYGPERILSLFRSQLGPTALSAAPPPSAAMGYGQAAGDLAARSAAIQSAGAIRGLQERPGLSGAALQALAGNVAQQAAGGVGEAALSGYGQGLGLLQQSRLANQDALNRARMAELGVLEGSVGRAGGISSDLANQIIQASLGKQQERAAQRAEERQRGWDLAGQIVGGAGRFLGAGAAPGGWMNRGGGGGGWSDPWYFGG